MVVPVLAEIERWFEIVSQFHDCVELAADFAAKPFERPDAPLGQELFQFPTFKCATGHCFPQNQSTGSTFECSVTLVERAATAFRTFHLKRLKISAHAVAFEILRLLHDLSGELSNVRHEIVALHCALFHP